MLQTSKQPVGYLLAVTVGLAIPSIVFGRSVVGVLLLIGLLTALFTKPQTISRNLQSPLGSTAAILVTLTVLSWLPSFASSLDVSTSFQVIIRMLLMIVGALILYAALCDEDKGYEILLRTIVLAASVMYFIVIVPLAIDEYYTSAYGIDLHWTGSFVSLIRGHSWSDHVYNLKLHLKEAASAALLLIPMIVWAAYRLRGRWALLAAFAIFELLAIIWLTYNRSSIAGLVAILCVICVLLALRSKSRRTTSLMALAIVAIIGVMAWWLVSFQPRHTWFPEDVTSWLPFWLIDVSRQSIWAFAWEASSDSRWFGVGINVIDKLPFASEWSETGGTRNIPLHPHNWIVEIIVETGILGFTAMASTIVYFMISMCREFLKTGNWAVLAALSVWTGYWTNGLFSVSYWSAWWQVSFFVATAICLAGRSVMESPPSTGNPSQIK